MTPGKPRWWTRWTAARRIRRSGQFRPAYYRAQLRGDAPVPADLVAHYVARGARAGLDPHPQFHGRSYLERHPELAASGANPFAHYLAHGEDPLERDVSAEVPFAPGARTAIGAPVVAVAGHAFHAELAPELRGQLEAIPFPCDLFLTTDTPAKRAAVAGAFEGWPRGRVEVRICENRGRDVAARLVALRDVHERYPFVLHVHTKRSAHDAALAPWRRYLLETLVGSTAIVESVFQAFAEDPLLGIVAAQHFEPVCPWIAWMDGLPLAQALAGRMGFAIDPRGALDFPSGSMFWARSAALGPLLELRLASADFEAEEGQVSGTLAHAVERLAFFVCERAGFRWMKIARPDLCPNTSGIAPIPSLEALRRHLTGGRRALTSFATGRRDG